MFKQFLILLSILSFCFVANAQNINRVEYYFDTDPGFNLGSSINITGDSVEIINTTVDLSGLTDGMHILYFRAKDDSGRWSFSSASPIVVSSQAALSKIGLAEYFFDTDPGFGNGIISYFSPDTTLTTTIAVNLDTIPAGFHTLYLRVQNENGIWSQATAYPFINAGSQTNPLLSNVEYFIDNDPGLGLGTNLSLPTDTLANENINADLSAVPAGFHILSMRAKDNLGQWSHTTSMPFISTGSNQLPDISAIEYFFNNDPGFGNGQSLSFTQDTLINQNFTLDLSSVNEGYNQLYIRTANNDGFWSHTYSTPVIVSNGELDSIIAFEYFLDADSGLATGNINYFNSPDSIQMYNGTLDLYDASPGFHILSLRAKSQKHIFSHTISVPIIVSSDEDVPAISKLYAYIDSSTAVPQIIYYSDSINVYDTAQADLSLTSRGMHKLYLQAEDFAGRKSLMSILDFCTGTKANFTSDTACLGSSLTLNNESYDVDASSQFQWDFYNDGSIDSNSPSQALLSPSTSGQIPVKLITIDNNNCADTVLLYNLINPVPVAPFINAGNPQICGNDSVFLSSNGFQSYSWSTGSIDSTTFVYKHDAGLISLTVSNQFGCLGTDTLTVKLLTLPVLNGTVKYDSLGTPVNLKQGELLIFYGDTVGNLDTLTTVSISNGSFFQTDIPVGYIALLSSPDSASYYPKVPSIYYGGSDNWNNALAIEAVCEDTLNLNILHSYVNPNFLNGDGIIDGYVYEGILTGRPGEPIRGIDIILEDVPGGGNNAFRKTDAAGYFKFNNVPNGNFKIKVNIPGRMQDDVNYEFNVNLTGGQLYDSTVVFYFNDTLIFIRDTTGADTINVNPLEAVVEVVDKEVGVYPNPNNGMFTISVKSSTNLPKEISVYDINGKLISRRENLNWFTANAVIDLSSLHLSPGIYYLRLKNDEGVKVVQIAIGE